MWSAATPWEGLRLLDQSMASALSRYADVLYVDPPISFLTRFRNPAIAHATVDPGITQVADSVWRLSVRVPPLHHRWPFQLAALWVTRRAVARGVARLGRRHARALVVTTLSPVLGSAAEEVSVLYCKDDYAAGADLIGLPRERSRLMQRGIELASRADVVVAVSTVIQQSMRAPGVEPLLIPNGVELDHFAAVPCPHPHGRPVVAFVGQLSERVDVDLLAAVAEAGVRVRMIGPTQRTLPAGHFQRLSALGERIEWTGAVGYAELPARLGDVTTCLVPYADTSFNRASFPLKILEYLAAGRRVVSTPLPAVEWLDTELVTTAASAADFAVAVKDSIAMPLTDEEIARRRRFAQGHAWRDRAELLARALGLSLSANPPSTVARRI